MFRLCCYLSPTSNQSAGLWTAFSHASSRPHYQTDQGLPACCTAQRTTPWPVCVTLLNVFGSVPIQDKPHKIEMRFDFHNGLHVAGFLMSCFFPLWVNRIDQNAESWAITAWLHVSLHIWDLCHLVIFHSSLPDIKPMSGNYHLDFSLVLTQINNLSPNWFSFTVINWSLKSR